MTTKTLPNKLSELIGVALADLARVEKSKKYEVDMAYYHMPDPRGVCVVCLAGSVIAKTLRADIRCDASPGMYDHKTSTKLRALSNLALGDTYGAIQTLNPESSADIHIRIPSYNEDRAGFKRALRRVKKELEARNL